MFRKRKHASISERKPLMFVYSLRFPPVKRSNTMYDDFLVLYTESKLIRLGWEVARSSSISFWNRAY